MNQSEYGQLVVFLAIAKEGSITGAARKLAIAAPSVSKSLKLLEQKIGAPLFIRTTRQIQLTEAGMQLLSQTDKAMEILQTAFESVQNKSGEPSGTVRITLSQTAYYMVLQPIYAEFCHRYPKIHLDISIDNATVNLIEQGYDVGIRFGDSVEEGMVARQIFPSVLEGLYASPDYLAQFGTPKVPEELSVHRWIGFRFITANRLHPIQLNVKNVLHTIDLKPMMICNDTSMLIDAARQNLGFIQLFEPIWQHHARDLVPILKPYWKRFAPTYVYYPQNSQKIRRVRTLIEFLLEKHNELSV
ncbi:LysR family transcriptional regulator [Gallibacterium salpingitidis]|uniref:LysR family transcriptional regulator n=1 Tax=Gallibacterium salpingitidis TaxID=505341 RepID=A0AB36E2B7_9PAST|nr:LysR family transcriptional regulator [Gallibacterium salpingitidis]OBX08832.1 LysR family transcriptional regulator [Gallibacterium salpingitidis]OBX10261.1 LysR family transcriptional regulator [Gallibacterium salpingitidis]